MDSIDRIRAAALLGRSRSHIVSSRSHEWPIDAARVLSARTVGVQDALTGHAVFRPQLYLRRDSADACGGEHHEDLVEAVDRRLACHHQGRPASPLWMLRPPDLASLYHGF
jgi:hypothetical protein